METISYLFSLATQVHWSLVLGVVALVFSTLLLLSIDSAAHIEGALYFGIVSVLSFSYPFAKEMQLDASTVFGFITIIVMYIAVGFFFAKKFVKHEIQKEDQRFNLETQALTDYCVKKLHSNVDAVGNHTAKMVKICFDLLSGNITEFDYIRQMSALTNIPFKVGISQDLNDEIRRDLILKWVVGHSLDFMRTNSSLNYLHSYSVQRLFGIAADNFDWIQKEINTDNVFSLTRAYVLAWPVAVIAEVLRRAPSKYQKFKEDIVATIVKESQTKCS